MKNYLFEIAVNVQDHNYYYQDVRPFTVNAENVNEAIEKATKELEETYYMEFSKSALKRKSEMYVDRKNGTPELIGYVITAHTEFENGCGKWVKKVIELWTTIKELRSPFESINA